MTTDQRGFASIIQSEAAEFLSEEQVLLNATVKTIKYSNDRVWVSMSDGTSLSADYALVTFSLGVLQHDDVLFEPALPKWKSEAIHGMAMVSRVTRDGSSPSYNRAQGTYTKIYLQFPEKFWFDTEVLGLPTVDHWRSDVRHQFALYAGHERGWYPVWQSLDIDGFFPGSGVLFVTVTVSISSFFSLSPEC